VVLDIKKVFATLFFLANVLVILSPLFTKSLVNDYEDLKHAAFGLPFPYIEQDLTGNDPPFPIELSMYSPWEYPISVNLIAFLGSLAVVNVTIYIVYYLVRQLYIKRGRKTVP